MRVLLTGGTGYIGSHVAVKLIESRHEVVIIDNLSNSKISVLDRIKKITGIKPVFDNIDMCDESLLLGFIQSHSFDSVIHLAGYKAVAESVSDPHKYYANNIMSALNLCKAMKMGAVTNIVFSSSATVYGHNPNVPYYENYPISTLNPYGRTKAFIEEILKDVVASNDSLNVTTLRYFNPVGAHPTGLLGEDPNGTPNNLMPIIGRVAKGIITKLQVFGNDYSTLDGTCVRDYIHIMDLADAHVKALEKMSTSNGFDVYNVGTGIGTSVLNLIHTFEKVNNIKIEYEVVGRRPGDVAVCYANANKAMMMLGWKAIYNLQDMCRDEWNWQQNQDLIS